jgi:hypothetical protein
MYTPERNLLHILKSILSLVSFAVLGGLSLAIYSGIAIELIYPEIFNDYWKIWWKGWVLIALAWFLLKSQKQTRKRKFYNERLR